MADCQNEDQIWHLNTQILQTKSLPFSSNHFPQVLGCDACCLDRAVYSDGWCTRLYRFDGREAGAQRRWGNYETTGGAARATVIAILRASGRVPVKLVA